MSAPSLPSLPRRLLSEYVATALLVTAVIGSGIMAEGLSGDNVALALLTNTFATVGALYVLAAHAFLQPLPRVWSRPSAAGDGW